MRLNERAIPALTPPSNKGNRIQSDDEADGLGFRITANGAQSFVFG